MSYDIQLYRREVMEREQQYQGDDDFFENEANLLPFTPEQHQALHERLLQYYYLLTKNRPDEMEYKLKGHSATALLTARALYFAAAFVGDAIFEIGMTASEFTDTGEFAKYDPQAGGWEEITG